MHLLYTDESGSVGDAKQQFFVLAGFSVFERQGYWFAQELDKIAARFDPADPTSVELHGNPSGINGGLIRNLAEVPLFLDSKAFRLIQLADLIAYAIFRYYEFEDDRFFSIIKNRFDAEGGIVHGLCART